MHVHVLPKEITYRLPHRESDRIFPLLFALMFNIHKEIRLVKTPSPIAPLVNVTIRQRSLAICTVGTNGKLLSRLEYH